MPRFFTRKGDDGTTGLLGRGRVPKHALRPRTYGTVDEASAALGLARSLLGSEEARQVLTQVQRDLYHLMAEVAATAEEAERFRTIDANHIEWLEGQIEKFGRDIGVPSGFVLGGDTTAGAALDLARTIVRRAERLVAELQDEGELSNPHLLRYLNRLSSLCYVLLLLEDHEAGFDHTSRPKGENG
jgi:cob(I)alamin adenosyltransferase